jgi:hypothetical protein
MARPTSYQPEYAEQAEKLSKLGLTDKEMAEFFGVTERTLNTWKTKHPEFLQALKKGKTLADANVVESLYRRACGYSHEAVKIMQYEGKPVVEPYIEHYPPDTTACLAWLHNRQREKWQRNPDPAGGGADLPPTKIVFEVQDARTRKGGEDAA